MEEIRPEINLDTTLMGALYDVEHAINIYADTYFTLPAEGIYDREALSEYLDVINTCHIYIIGYTPLIELKGAEQHANTVVFSFSVGDVSHEVPVDIPNNWMLKKTDARFYFEDAEGKKYDPKMKVMERLGQVSDSSNFEVKYIGQAYGKDGSRTAIDRLLKHETLQKIALKGAPPGKRISILMLALQPGNRVLTVMSPFAENTDDDNSRVHAGLDKLFNTTEEEQISLFEAAFIRYFYPEFNIEFKDSFPSTKLNILQDCYQKDFSAVIAEICHDELPYKLYSDKISPKDYHIASFDLHKSSNRKIFFGL